MSGSLPIPVDPAQEVRIPVSELQPVIEKLLVKNSVFQFDAVVAAERMLEADLYGVPSHGVALLPRILNSMDCGDIDPRARVLTLKEAPCFAVLDGSRSIGSIAASKGAELAAAKALELGVGVVAIGDSQTLGAAEVYVRLMARSNVIGICLSSTGGATVTAPGTTHGAVGNCALAYAVPIAGTHPLVFDSACGHESWGKLRLLEKYGIPLPENLIFDKQGISTSTLATAAAILPNGGALGFGLSMLCSILAGPLCGGWLPIHKKRRVDAEDSQHFFLALDPAKFCDVDKFQGELTTTLDEIRDLPPINPLEPVRIPGDRGAACHADALENGVPVHQSIAEEIKALATRKKIPVSW
ncbi:Ldh family oxidoreductase [Planctomicrobium sp. SH661]|uniref:Ldh family oxidoreductase n=1 Tax=Planctomicrobium sp. SH661 TaxID=3448124 RepID=UPI003F5C9CD0